MTDEPLTKVFSALDQIGIPFMLTGSYASNVYGKVRSTFDADLIVLIDAKSMGALGKALGDDFFMDCVTLAEVREAGNQFNAIHKSSGLKIDFYFPPADEYSKIAFGRRRIHSLFGRNIAVIAPEDLILAKLRWAKSGGSQRQIDDARGVLDIQRATLDFSYLRNWAKQLSIADLLAAIEKG